MEFVRSDKTEGESQGDTALRIVQAHERSALQRGEKYGMMRKTGKKTRKVDRR